MQCHQVIYDRDDSSVLTMEIVLHWLRFHQLKKATYLSKISLGHIIDDLVQDCSISSRAFENRMRRVRRTEAQISKFPKSCLKM